MKAAQRHPICFTNFKSKPLCTSTWVPNNTYDSKEVVNLATTLNSHPMAQQAVISGDDMTKGQPLQGSSLNATQEHACVSNQFLQLKQMIDRQDLLLKISQLENFNSELVAQNRELKEKLQKQETDRAILSRRIETLEKLFLKLESQFEQQFSSSSKSVQKIGSISMSQACTKAKQTSLLQKCSQEQQSRGMTQSIGTYRRYSFSQNSMTFEDLSNKVKQYRNKLEVEKVKRFNLQKELSICRDNIKVEFKIEIDGLHRKIDLMQQSISRKDKQINEKEDLISRYILNK